jgi:hypothetical protein
MNLAKNLDVDLLYQRVACRDWRVAKVVPMAGKAMLAPG